MAGNQIDLLKLFSQVAKTVASNRTELNQADTQNKDHGDNMVEIFNVITLAMNENKNAKPADQLEIAAKMLREKESGSAQLYSKGLLEAAKEFQGKAVTTGNALQLVQALLGGGEPTPAKPAANDPLGSILSGLTGGSNQSDNELDAGDLLNAGLAFLSAKQSGDSNVDALIKAVVNSSAMGTTPHRAQSSELVMNTLLDVIGKIAKK